MMRVRLFLILCALLFAGGCSDRFEKVENEIGYIGPARRDPFLAAERFLTERDFEVSTMPYFGQGPGRYGTLIAPAQSFVNYGMSEQVMEWVREGGHFIVFLRAGETWRDDWGKMRLKDLEEPDSEMTRLFEELGVDEVKSEEKTVTGTILGRKVSLKSPATFTWKSGKKPTLTFALGEPEAPAVAAFSEGRGTITIVANAQPFRNRYIGKDDNAWTLWLLAGHAQTRTSVVWFLQGARVSFFAMLWENAWMAIIAFLALIAFWLWRHLPRFGPLRRVPELSTRDFAAHLGVIGAFQWRHGQVKTLLDPLREAIRRAGTRRGWPADKIEENVAALTGMTPAQIQAVMTQEPRDPHTFVSVVRDLQTIATTLRA